MRKSPGEDFSADWKITTNGTNVPDLLDDGSGYFLRPVDGSSRQVGSAEGDAIRNFTGHFTGGENGKWAIPFQHSSGVFQRDQAGTATKSGGETMANAYRYVMFDVSHQVPTAHENRPKNIGMTPAIYLGV